jgi:transposase
MQVYVGIDWSEAKHDVVFMNSAGSPIAQSVIPHTHDGFLKLEVMRLQLGIPASDCMIALETAHNLLIDFLWSHGYSQLYVIPPSVVRGNRSRYVSSGARSDPSDALLLADLLRTDRRRLQPWKPDSLLTRRIRANVSLINYLTRSNTRLNNRLRAVLLRYYPAALQVFSSLTSLIALEFVRAYPTPQAARALSIADFKLFARQHRYPNPQRLPACYARLQADCPQADSDTVSVFQQEAALLACMLLHSLRAKKQALAELRSLFSQHPDFPIFSSLPGAGDFLAPALLAKFGDDRQRFPSPSSVQALAGTCPITDTSGKRRVIKFRRACDREFRYIAQQWARASLKRSVWANAYWQRLLPHSRSNSHAYRCLANRWLAIAWKLWQSRQPYDEEYHLHQRLRHSRSHRQPVACD